MQPELNPGSVQKSGRSWSSLEIWPSKLIAYCRSWTGRFHMMSLCYVISLWALSLVLPLLWTAIFHTCDPSHVTSLCWSLAHVLLFCFPCSHAKTFTCKCEWNVCTVDAPGFIMVRIEQEVKWNWESMMIALPGRTDEDWRVMCAGLLEEQRNSLKCSFLAAVLIHNTHGNASSSNKLTQKAIHADVTFCNMTLTVTCSDCSDNSNAVLEMSKGCGLKGGRDNTKLYIWTFDDSTV